MLKEEDEAMLVSGESIPGRTVDATILPYSRPSTETVVSGKHVQGNEVEEETKETKSVLILQDFPSHSLGWEPGEGLGRTGWYFIPICCVETRFSQNRIQPRSI